MPVQIEVEYSTPRFRDINEPNITATQSGRRLTIAPRRAKVYPADGDRPLRAYVEGRSVIQSTGNPGQHNRSIAFGTQSESEYDDVVPMSDAPEWLREMVARVEAFEALRVGARV